MQERDEYSEVARIHALEEKYKAEVSQLAKDSQAVSSVSHENTDIAIGRSIVEIYRPLSPTMYSIGSRSSVGSYALAMSPTHQLAIPIMYRIAPLI